MKNIAILVIFLCACDAQTIDCPAGEQGEQGPQGETGATGERGPRGFPGAPGTIGDTQTAYQNTEGAGLLIVAATCPDETLLVGGGCDWGKGLETLVTPYQSRPDGNAWLCSGVATGPSSIGAYAVCAE